MLPFSNREAPVGLDLFALGRWRFRERKRFSRQPQKVNVHETEVNRGDIVFRHFDIYREMLLEPWRWFTVDEIFARWQDQVGECHRRTIRRTLDTLVDCGVLGRKLVDRSTKNPRGPRKFLAYRAYFPEGSSLANSRHERVKV